MNILLLGKGGQVGWELQRALAPLGTVIAHDLDTADFSQPEQVSALVAARKTSVFETSRASMMLSASETRSTVLSALYR